MRSYAKVNIGLIVKDKRQDGYHDIETIFHLVNLFDEIDFMIEENGKNCIVIERNVDYLESGACDLMEKAYRAFIAETGLCFSLHIKIVKNIPVAGGLGGGSSDAASTLEYMNTYFKEPLGREEMFGIARKLGADVPFFLTSWPAAYAEGIGEKLQRIEPISLAADIFIPENRAKTDEMYALLDKSEAKKDRHLAKILPKIPKRSDFPNDFELVNRDFQKIEHIMEDYPYYSLSGSGSCFFGLRNWDDEIKLKKNIDFRYENLGKIPSFLISNVNK